MDKRELLAQLTAHGVDPAKVSGSGRPNTAQMDVAGMMKRCTPREQALLRCKYAGDPIHEIWAYWFEHLMGQGWNLPKGKTRRLSQVTIAEHVSDNRCGLCDGTQGWMVGSKWQACPICEGAGVIHLTDDDIAKRLKIKRLGEPWRERLNWCRSELITWEQVALSKMR